MIDGGDAKSELEFGYDLLEALHDGHVAKPLPIANTAEGAPAAFASSIGAPRETSQASSSSASSSSNPAALGQAGANDDHVNVAGGSQLMGQSLHWPCSAMLSWLNDARVANECCIMHETRRGLQISMQVEVPEHT